MAKKQAELKPDGPFKPWGMHMRGEMDRMTGKDKVYDKQAADAKANRKESEREVEKARGYAAGGEVRGYGAARKNGRGCKGA